MKKLALWFAVSIFLIFATFSYSQTIKRAIVYDEKNGVFIPSGWMGDYEAIKLDNQSKNRPRRGKYCQKWTYTISPNAKNGWAGVYWQYPPNNWGGKKGRDMRGFKKVSFWVKGEKGNEWISIKVGGIKGENPDSLSVELGKIRLTTEWRKYEIDISDKNLSSVSGGFCWAADSKDNPSACIFYFDDIMYE